jgi:hypothetical protein
MHIQFMPNQIAPKRKLSMGDINDATLGNPAIFQKQDALKEAQRGIVRPVAFRPHLAMGLAIFY